MDHAFSFFFSLEALILNKNNIYRIGQQHVVGHETWSALILNKNNIYHKDGKRQFINEVIALILNKNNIYPVKKGEKASAVCFCVNP